jgi:hypothetical protein
MNLFRSFMCLIRILEDNNNINERYRLSWGIFLRDEKRSSQIKEN